MLNQTLNGSDTELKLHPKLANADWCVGDAPSRWDVSFADRLWLTLRRLFARDAAEPRRMMRVMPAVELERRQAA